MDNSMTWREWFAWVLFGKRPEPLPPNTNPWPTQPPSANETAAKLLILHNDYRAERRVSILLLNGKLCTAAQVHADAMAKADRMSHQLPGEPVVSDRIATAGYLYRSCGENIAAGQTTPASVFRDWIGSPPHRNNILNPAYWNVGFGVAVSAKGWIYWCVVFGQPPSSMQLASGVTSTFTHTAGGVTRWRA